MSKDSLPNSRQTNHHNLKLVPQPRRSSSSSEAAESLNNGISGSAMAVPPPKTLAPGRVVETTRSSKELVRTRRSLSTPKSDPMATSNVEAKRSKEVIDKARELRDALAREKRLQQQVASLQQLVDTLRVELAEKTQTNVDLDVQLKLLEKQRQEQMEKSLGDQQKIKELEQKCKQFQEKEVDKNNQLQRHLQIISDLETLNKKQETEMVELRAEKDREIATRDTKLDRLKQQMADALKDNSRERQQQLDELSKNLEKVQEEADILRTQLRAIRKNTSKDGCINCEKMATKMAQFQTAVSTSDKTVKELRDKIAELEKQSSENGPQQRRASVECQKSKPSANRMQSK